MNVRLGSVSSMKQGQGAFLRVGAGSGNGYDRGDGFLLQQWVFVCLMKKSRSGRPSYMK